MYPCIIPSVGRRVTCVTCVLWRFPFREDWPLQTQVCCVLISSTKVFCVVSILFFIYLCVLIIHMNGFVVIFAHAYSSQGESSHYHFPLLAIALVHGFSLLVLDTSILGVCIPLRESDLVLHLGLGTYYTAALCPFLSGGPRLSRLPNAGTI